MSLYRATRLVLVAAMIPVVLSGVVAAQREDLPSLPAVKEAAAPLLPSEVEPTYDDFVGTYHEESAHVRIRGREWFLRFELLGGGLARWSASDDGVSVYEITGQAMLTQGRLRIEWGPGERMNRLDFVPEVDDFIAFTWGSRHYLLPEAEAESFVSGVESGVEPNDRNTYHGGRAWSDFPYVRSGERLLPVEGLPRLPLPWRDVLRAVPVEASLVALGDDDGWIDRGERSGLRLHDRLAVFDATVAIPQQARLLVEVVELEPDRARVTRPSTLAYELRVGQRVSTLQVVNHRRLPVSTRSVKNGDKRLNRIPESRLVLSLPELEARPGTSASYPAWRDAVRAFVGRDDSLDPPETLIPQPDRRATLDAVPLADLTPVILNEALRVPVSRPATVRQAANLVAYWNERQRGAYMLDFDADDQRITPLALIERLQALHDWAEWWRATAADPARLRAWEDAVADAGGG